MTVAYCERAKATGIFPLAGGISRLSLVLSFAAVAFVMLPAECFARVQASPSGETARAIPRAVVFDRKSLLLITSFPFHTVLNCLAFESLLQRAGVYN